MTLIAYVLKNRKIGPILWTLCIQLLLAEYVVSLAWPFHYSRAINYISDLGAVHCAVLTSGFSTVSHPVCSPLHNVMNASFIVQGLLIAAGAVFMRKLFPAGKVVALSTLLFILSGAGFIAAGLAPNDVNLPVRYTAAVVIFLGASSGMIVLAAALARQEGQRVLALFTLASGIVALAGTILIANGVTLGLGVGGIERVAVYPHPVWLTLIGLYYLCRRERRSA